MERRTEQRDAIRRAIELADRPLGPQEILTAACQWAPSLGIATVYRTVKAGLAEGWLAPVDLPNSPRKYEMAGKKHHHHFECRSCGQVFEVLGCPGNLSRLLPKGFTLVDHEVVLYGRCRTCNH